MRSKENALVGASIALFMTDALMGAAKDLAAHSEKDPQRLLEQLEKEEDEAYETIHAAAISPSLVTNNFRPVPGIDDPVSTFIKAPTICHSARLPSQSRFLGHLTSTDKRGDVAMFGNETYDVGIEDVEALKVKSGGVMRLVWTMYNERVAAKNCAPDAILSPDYYDFWLTSSEDGWNHLQFPNKDERAAYGYGSQDLKKFKGYIVLYPMEEGKEYYGGKKPLLPGLTDTHFKEKKWEIMINDQVVTDLVQITTKRVGGAHGFLAVGPSGKLTFDANANVSYTIKIKVNEKGSYVRLRTVVVY